MQHHTYVLLRTNFLYNSESLAHLRPMRCVKYRVESTVRFERVVSSERSGPQSNLDFVHFIWNNFAYYCTNYAVAVLPMQTCTHKILYARFYKAEIGGDIRALVQDANLIFLQILVSFTILAT
jgi:hypothetical protein